MKTLADQLSQYAAYHRDPRNIATHFVGIPMIVVATQTLLSRPVWNVAGLPLTLALAVSVASVLYYLSLDLAMGLLMGVLFALGLHFGASAAALSVPVWLAIGIGGFVLGWAAQFLGHAVFEHRKPAFLDDVASLMIGPLFVVAEALFMLGLRPALNASIKARVGGLRVR